MQLILVDKQKRIIKNKEGIKFFSFSSYHLIAVTARVKGEKQLGQNHTDDEELIVRIADKVFPKLGSKEALFNSPASFNGGSLHNLAKTVYFLTFLKGRDHSVILETDKKPNTATFESLQVYTLNLLVDKKVTLDINHQAEDGDRRPWITFVLDNLPIESITPTITYSRRKRDSDDVKVIIDGKTQRNIVGTVKHFFWRFVGSLLYWFSPTKTETETFTTNLPQGLHYIEFEADRIPILEKITFDFRLPPSIPEGIATIDNPKWTEDFYEDTEDILLARLILGEAENEPKEAKAWPNTVHGVILQEGQYDPFKISDSNFDKITDPFRDVSSRRENEWQESWEAAHGILSGKINNSTEATHFHGLGVSKEWFLDTIVPKGRFIKQIGNTYFYWSPN